MLLRRARLTRVANAHAQSWVLVGAELVGDGGEAVVPAGTPPLAESKGAKRQAEIVYDHEQRCEWHALGGEQLAHGNA